MKHCRLRRTVAPIILIALVFQLFALPGRPLAAASALLTPEANAFFGFSGSQCPAAYPAFGVCRFGDIVNSGFSEPLPGSNPVDLSKLNLDQSGVGTLRITSTTGDAYQNSNPRQDNALTMQFDASRRPFSIGVRLLPPFNLNRTYQSAGLLLGLDTNNYAKLVLAFNSFGGSQQRGIQFGVETNGAFVDNTNNPALPNVSQSLDLFFSADPQTRTLQALYRVDSDDPDDIVAMNSLPLDAKFFAGAIHGGLITTNNGGNNPFTFAFDWFKIGAYVRPGADTSGISFAGPTRIVDKLAALQLDPNANFANPTTLAIGPDGRLYAGTYAGVIYSFALDANNNPSDVRVYPQLANRANRTCPSSANDPLVPPVGQVCPLDPLVTGRQLLGIGFGPDSTPSTMQLYATHSDPRYTQDSTSSVAKQIDTNSGTLSRLTLDSSGALLADEDLLTGLPRSREFHSINGISFDNDGWLYIAQGGNTNNGSGSHFFSYLPESYLSAAVLRVKPSSLTAPIDLRQVVSSGDLAQYSGSFEVFGTGLRNPYDIVWHSNGKLYANVNGSNGGLGTTPGPSDGCPNGVASGISTQSDALEWVEANTYAGHPNPARGECVWEDGAYPGNVNLAPAANYTPPVYLYGSSRSVNGIAEYTAANFGGQMQGDLVVAAYAGSKGVRRIVLASNGESVLSDQVLTQALGTPLDVVVAANGTILIADLGNALNPNSNPGGIYTLTPNDSDPVAATCHSAGVDPAMFDSDSDGFLDQDEIDNGTDICSAASTPIDSNADIINAVLPGGYLLSDLHDPDIDGDSLLNNAEQLQFDDSNGSAQPLPLFLDFSQETGGIQKTGFRGALLRDDAGQTLASNGGSGFGLVDTNQRLQANGVSGALGLLATSGSSRGLINNQDNFLQVGFDATTDAFSITTELGTPFDGVTTPVTTPEEAGLLFGLNADNNVRLTLGRLNSGAAEIRFSSETLGVVSDGLGQSITPMIPLPFEGTVRLALVGDPEAGYLAARYSLLPSGLGQEPTPWQTIAVLHNTNADLAPYFIPAGCANPGPGCVAIAGLAATGADIAYGFTEFRIDPFIGAPAGDAVSSFVATRPGPTTGPVELEWATDGQALLAGFHLYRASVANRAAATRITSSLIAPTGDALEPQSYSYSDASAPSNPVYYWLEPVLVSGATGSNLATALNAKANQTIDFAGIAQATFGDAPLSLAATASSGLAISYSASGDCSLSGTTLTLNGAGSCTISATQPGNATYNPAPAVVQSFGIAKANAAVAVTSATYVFNGAPQPANATSTPAALPLTLSYTGVGATGYGPSTDAPTNAGEYRVEAVISSSNYQGSATGSLLITPAVASIELGGLRVSFNGAPRAPTINTTPAALGYSVSYTGIDPTQYGPSGVAPQAVGRYMVRVTITGEPNYTGEADAILEIVSGSVVVAVDSRSVVYTGVPQSVGVATTPSELTYDLVYSGVDGTLYGPSGSPPTNAGAYAATATVRDPNYTGEATGMLTILRAQAEIVIDALDVTYDGTAKPVTVTVVPADLVPSVTYSGVEGTSYGPTASAPTDPGAYLVEVMIDGPNYTGAATRILTIGRAAQTISFPPIADRTLGDEPFLLGATASSGLAVSAVASGVCAVDAGQVTLLGAGSCTISVAQPGSSTYLAAAEVSRTFSVTEPAAVPDVFTLFLPLLRR